MSRACGPSRRQSGTVKCWMLALVYDGKVELRTDYPTPKPARGEVLVAVRMAGICRTDLEILKGYMGAFCGVMGHEFVGTVVEGPGRWKSKRVVAEINCICQQCDMCRSGLSNHCRSRTVLGIDGRDGVFAEYVAVPARNLHEVPANVSDAEAVFVEPLAAAIQVLRQVEIGSSTRVIVLGDGRLGQLVGRVVKSRTARLLLVGRHAGRLEAAEKQGIRAALADQFVPDGTADVVVDATGTPAGFQLAMQAVRPRGTIVLKSTFAGRESFDLAPLVIDEIIVVGSRCGPFDEAIRWLAAKEQSARHVDVSALISRRLPLRDGLAALESAGDPKNLKVLLDVARA